jgi:hypothetical protein
MKPEYTVTGRAWCNLTRDHSKLVEMTFERRYEAIGFMNTNREWIKGMVLDRNEAARRIDNGEA